MALAACVGEVDDRDGHAARADAPVAEHAVVSAPWRDACSTSVSRSTG